LSGGSVGLTTEQVSLTLAEGKDLPGELGWLVLLSVSLNLGLPHSWCKSIIERGNIRAQRRSTLAQPYIDRLNVFGRLLACPSVWPLLQVSAPATLTASISRQICFVNRFIE